MSASSENLMSRSLDLLEKDSQGEAVSCAVDLQIRSQRLHNLRVVCCPIDFPVGQAREPLCPCWLAADSVGFASWLGSAGLDR